ncbi:MAG: hypothetical protein RL189_2742 [Pseudomonadota bacterium]|jgi:hypothetical protein
MKNSIIKVLSLLMTACAADTSVPVQENSWKLELVLPSGRLLSDGINASSDDFSMRLGEIRAVHRFFNDPVRLAENSTPFDLRLTAHGSSGEQVYAWRDSPTARQQAWKFAGCTTSAGVVACEYAPLVECLLQHARAGIEQSAFSTPEQSLLLDWSVRCGARNFLTSEKQGEASFTIEADKVLFTPSPLLSLQIYSGVWAEYEDALVAATPAASIPAQIPCDRADGACLKSPLPLDSCNGCAALQKGQMYTVFFLEALRQDYPSVRRVVFVP